MGGEDTSRERMEKVGVYGSAGTPTEAVARAVEKTLDEHDRRAIAVLHSLAQTRAVDIQRWNEMHLDVSEELWRRHKKRILAQMTDGELIRIDRLAEAAVRTDREILSWSASPLTKPGIGRAEVVSLRVEYAGQVIEFGPASQERVRNAFMKLLPPQEDPTAVIDIG
jgi:hypothetical protein